MCKIRQSSERRKSASYIPFISLQLLVKANCRFKKSALSTSVDNDQQNHQPFISQWYPSGSSCYLLEDCMFELHLIIWKREDGVSKICEYIVKKNRETDLYKIRQSSERRKSASYIPFISLKLLVEANCRFKKSALSTSVDNDQQKHQPFISQWYPRAATCWKTACLNYI